MTTVVADELSRQSETNTRIRPLQGLNEPQTDEAREETLLVAYPTCHQYLHDSSPWMDCNGMGKTLVARDSRSLSAHSQAVARRPGGQESVAATHAGAGWTPAHSRFDFELRVLF